MGVLYIGQSASYLSSAERIPIATTSILLYTYPAIVTVLARILLNERFTKTKMISLGLALAGTLLTLGAPQAANDWLGIVFGLGASFIYSTYIIIGAKVHGDAPPATQSAVITLTAGALLFLFGAATDQLNFNVAPEGWLGVLAVAALSTALPILFFLAAVPRIGASQTSIISTSELVSTAIFGLIFLSQPLTVLQLGGGILIFAAVLLLARSSG
jgi:drug/metabolite transporter (DMT)-like permease